MYNHPLYVHAHSKAILMQALSADTEFLVAHNVMDYSLLLGVCSDSQQIVVGVIGEVVVRGIKKLPSTGIHTVRVWVWA